MELLGIVRSVARRLAPLGVMAALVPYASGKQAFDEYQIKAAFLYNFTKFVEWPRVDGDAFRICVLGDDPFGPAIDKTVEGKTTGGKALRIMRIKDPAAAKECHMVYVREGEKAKAQQMIEAVRGLPVLTVGENTAFAHMGGVIHISNANERVEIGVNPAAASSQGLKISAKLMSLAKTYKE